MKNTKPHYFGFFGMIICLLADDIQDLTNINQWVFLSLGLAICFMPAYFWIKGWLKKEEEIA
jgi:hypothetical protein